MYINFSFTSAHNRYINSIYRGEPVLYMLSHYLGAYISCSLGRYTIEKVTKQFLGQSMDNWCICRPFSTEVRRRRFRMVVRMAIDMGWLVYYIYKI